MSGTGQKVSCGGGGWWCWWEVLKATLMFIFGPRLGLCFDHGPSWKIQITNIIVRVWVCHNVDYNCLTILLVLADSLNYAACIPVLMRIHSCFGLATGQPDISAQLWGLATWIIDWGGRNCHVISYKMGEGKGLNWQESKTGVAS